MRPDRASHQSDTVGTAACFIVQLTLLSVLLTGCSRAADPPSPTASGPQVRGVRKAASSGRSRLPVYELKLDGRALAGLEQSTFSNEPVPARFIAEEETYDPVRVRYRGDWARGWPKKPLKVFFSTNKPFEGRLRLNLNSGWRDPAFIRECLAYHIYAACGAIASTSQMVRVQMNGEFRGLYVEVEQPDKGFLARVGLKGASVYKAASHSNQADERDLGSEPVYVQNYRKETQKESGFGDLADFCHAAARTTNAVEFFTQRMDLQRYINFLAATILCQNWDTFNKNHYLVYDGNGSKKWYVVPWDLDRTLGDHWNGSFQEARLPALLGISQMPGVTGWNRLENRFVNDPALRAQLLDRLDQLLRTEFTEDKLFPEIDRLEAQIAPEAALDRRRWPGMVSADLHSGIAQVKQFIRGRRAFLLEELPRLRRAEAIQPDPSLFRGNRMFRMRTQE